MKHGKSQSSIPSETLVYAFAHVESWIESYAKATGHSFAELADGVATLLYAQTGGEVRRTQNRVPALSGNRPTRGKAVGKVAVAVSSHRKSPGKAAGRKLKSIHWTQRPENRKKMLRHLADMRQAKMAA